MLARYPWVERGDTDVISENLAAIFESREITAMPCHGSILVGEEVVRRHYQYLQSALTDRSAK